MQEITTLSRWTVGAFAALRSFVPLALALISLYHKGLLPFTPESVSHQAASWIDIVEVVLSGIVGKGVYSAIFAKSVAVQNS